MMSSHLLLLTFLYFIQGLPYGFQARFLPVYLRSKHMSLTKLGFFKLLLLPWLCKALWAPLVDKYGTKHKWLMGSVLALSITCLGASVFSPDHTTILCIVLFLLNLFASTQDIAVDAIAVSILSTDELAQGNTAQVVGYKVGSVFGGGILIWLIDLLGWAGLFLVLAAVYFEAFMFVYISASMKSLEPKIHMITDKSTDHTPQDGAAVINDENGEGKGEPQKCETETTSANPDDCKDTAESKTTPNGNASCAKKPEGTHETKVQKTTFFNKFDFIWKLFKVPGTQWMMVYLVCYKLGEQGAIGMLPLFLVDKDVPMADVTFWTGIVGQAMSIAGSLLGGCILTRGRVAACELLSQLSLYRLLPLAVQLWAVGAWTWGTVQSDTLFYVCISSMILLLLISGMITTATFTFMMQCSQGAETDIQATHYTTLATLEVLGKLLFMSVVGWLVDMVGYASVYLLFIILSLSLLSWLNRCPKELMENEEEDKEEEWEEGEGEEEDSTGREEQNVEEEKSTYAKYRDPPLDEESGKSDCGVRLRAGKKVDHKQSQLGHGPDFGLELDPDDQGNVNNQRPGCGGGLGHSHNPHMKGSHGHSQDPGMNGGHSHSHGHGHSHGQSYGQESGQSSRHSHNPGVNHKGECSHNPGYGHHAESSHEAGSGVGHNARPDCDPESSTDSGAIGGQLEDISCKMDHSVWSGPGWEHQEAHTHLKFKCSHGHTHFRCIYGQKRSHTCIYAHHTGHDHPRPAQVSHMHQKQLDATRLKKLT